jgi:hypothetical protein
MEWMGHADLATTRRYLAFVIREDAAIASPRRSASSSRTPH